MSIRKPVFISVVILILLLVPTSVPSHSFIAPPADKPSAPADGATPMATGKVCVLVEPSRYSRLQGQLSTYKSDLEAMGYTVEIRTDSWANAVAVRNFLKSQWQSNGLVGCVIVGDIPYAWFEIANDYGTVGDYARFPIDLFFTDLDGTWRDTSPANGIYDGHTATSPADLQPEIWLGRITIDSAWEDTTALIGNYLNKTHDYRMGNISLPQKALLYIDDDWQGSTSEWSTSLAPLYPQRTVVNDYVVTNATDYMQRLTQGYEWIQVHCHANHSSKTHTFKIHDGIDNDGVNGVDDDWECFRMGGVVNSSQVRSIDPKSLFYNVFTCGAANWSVPDYLCGWYISAKTYGLCAVSSTKVGGMLNYGDFYNPLSTGQCIGDSFKNWFSVNAESSWSWYYGMTVIGDPTLSPLLKDTRPPANVTGLGIGLSASNVMLNWTQPVTHDVHHYLIYRAIDPQAFDFSTPYHNTSSDVDPLVATWTDVGAGLGNVNSYFYIVRAVDNGWNVEKNAYMVGKWATPLSAGWNLVSNPLISENTSISSVLQGASWDYALHYDPYNALDHWQSNYVPRAPPFNDLRSVDERTGLWLRVSAPCSLTTAGKLPGHVEVPLRSGWNLVGYPSLSQRTVTSALTGLSYDVIEGFAPAAQYGTRVLAGGDAMKPGAGYWIHVTSDCTWVIEN